MGCFCWIHQLSHHAMFKPTNFSAYLHYNYSYITHIGCSKHSNCLTNLSNNFLNKIELLHSPLYPQDEELWINLPYVCKMNSGPMFLTQSLLVLNLRLKFYINVYKIFPLGLLLLWKLVAKQASKQKHCVYNVSVHQNAIGKGHVPFDNQSFQASYSQTHPLSRYSITIHCSFNLPHSFFYSY